MPRSSTSLSEAYGESDSDHEVAPKTARRKRTGEKGRRDPVKRRAQNKSAQRAFRERQAQKGRALEDRIAELEATVERQAEENAHLTALVERLRADRHVEAAAPSVPPAASSDASSVRTPQLSPTDIWVSHQTAWLDQVRQPPVLSNLPIYALPPSMPALFPGLPTLPTPSDIDGRFEYDWLPSIVQKPPQLASDL